VIALQELLSTMKKPALADVIVILKTAQRNSQIIIKKVVIANAIN
jgi:hypothetical protein